MTLKTVRNYGGGHFYWILGPPMARVPPETPIAPFHYRFDWAEIAPSIAVAESAANAIGTNPTAIPPLSKQIDVDALDDLLAGDRPSFTDETICVSFSFLDQEVMVSSNGDVYVGPEE